ncbi:MAG TPA: hypothetical protein ENN36_09045 [Candidatus Bathyarchaeota archaeon]|nr:hypothetical protein [Candidatus Bathyarchaeota archaeon]
MKRWITVLGRGGTVLIAISLALFLVSLIPPIQMSTTEGSGPFSPGGVRVLFHRQNFNPQQELEVEITVEGTITVYLLELDIELEFTTTTGFRYGFNVTDLQQILQEKRDLIIWEDPVENGHYKRSYIPTRVMNVTLVLYSSPDSESGYLEQYVALKSSLAPGEKVRNIAYLAAPIGAVLAIPWLVNMWKERKQS